MRVATHSPLAIIALVAVMGAGCGPRSPGKVRVLNGPTVAARVQGLAVPPPPVDGDGSYRLSPSSMSFSITGVSLLPEGAFDPVAAVQDMRDCTATYDRSLGSLAVLSDCGVEVPVGTFGGVTILYENRFDVVMDDVAAGIFSDPDAPGGLTTTRPPGGPRAIEVRDRNGDSDTGLATLFFSTPFTVVEGGAFDLSVVFDPTHWMVSDRTGDTFSAPQMSGNPPLIPAIGAFGKAAFYSTVDSPLSYRSSGPVLGYLFLYADDDTPVSVTWQEQDVCSRLGGGHVVSFAGDGVAVGTWGRLGLDAAGILAWASPGPVDQQARPPERSGYTGVYKMAEAQNVGDETTMSYLCTTEVPAPAAGENYASGAPDFIPEATLTLRLLAR